MIDRSQFALAGGETYIVEVEIVEGWNTVMLRLGTTWNMLLNEQER